MGKQVELNRQVFNKIDFNQTVNTEFTQLVDQPDPSFFDINLATQEDFFKLYDKFFYEIPKEGVVNSHTYLIQESTDYVGFEAQQEEIEALIQEITDLRRENLELRQESINAIVGIDSINPQLDVDLPTLPVDQILEEQPTTTPNNNTNNRSGRGGRGSGSGNLLAK
jgi:hypothetical protein